MNKAKDKTKDIPVPEADTVAKSDTKKNAKSSGGKGRGIGCLLVIAALGGGGYYAYQQPEVTPYMDKAWVFIQHTVLDNVNKFTKSTTADKPTAADKSTKPTATDKPAKYQQKPASSSASSNTAANTTNTANTANATNTANTANVGNTANTVNAAPSVNIAQMAKLLRRMIDLEERVADVLLAQSARREPSVQPNANSLELQFALIDIRLRQDGDTNAAANALLALESAPGINRVWVAGEVARLQNLPAREKIAIVIQRLMRKLSNKPSKTQPVPQPDTGIFAPLVDLLAVRRIAPAAAEDSLQRLQRLELLFLSGQRAAYVAALEDFSAHRPPTADDDMHLQIDLLKKFGAPQYVLNYGTSQ